MQTMPVVTFKGLEPSPALREVIEHRIADLEQHHPRLTSCRVVVEQPHQHQHHGVNWHVTVTLVVPGKVIVVSHEPDANPRHEDPYAAVRDAFSAADRRLREHDARRSGR